MEKQYKFTIDCNALIIEKTIKVDGEYFKKADSLPLDLANAVFAFIFNKYYIPRNKKDFCDCMDGAIDNCEICCPDSFKNYIFKDDLKDS